jgi:hypothetical protein
VDQISLEEVATLDVSSASGCVIINDLIWVVADDEAEVFVYNLEGERQNSIGIFGEKWPSDSKIRKRVKADLESICSLGNGQLLALGSGSKPNRCRGVLIQEKNLSVTEVDTSPLYRQLKQGIPDLNIEGSVVVGDTLFLGQRGNSALGMNSLILLSLDAVLKDLENDRIGSQGIKEIIPLQLGSINNVPYSLTDLAPAASGELWFTAAAEDTDDPYLDGDVTGALIGKMTVQGTVLWKKGVEPIVKLEGVFECKGALFLVCDADDPEIKSSLFQLDVKNMEN